VDGTGSVLIFGASARAAAFSALRAGLEPWCADLFADADLRQRVPAMRLPGRYPDSFLDLIGVELPGPWMYTGGLENRPFLVHAMANRRPLWGNGRTALVDVRSPHSVTSILHGAGLPAPHVWWSQAPYPPGGRRWLMKPVAGSGGAGIRFFSHAARFQAMPSGYYLQQFLEGESRSAIYLGDGSSARLLGVTRQLVGCDWLHADAFRYCGSVGPLPLTPQETAALGRLGNILAARCYLRGLFGVDGIWRRGTLWPVEVNPRYTASVEVIEYATGLQALTWHGLVFEANSLPRGPVPDAVDVVGKAIVFARETIAFPADGPWSEALSSPRGVDELPAFADIPVAGATVEAGHPVLTVFARAATVAACETALREISGEVDRRLFGP
jgi:predicted ATP-grasp superfamily ATP-dependent carboligase